MTFSVCFESLRVGKYIRTVVSEASGKDDGRRVMAEDGPQEGQLLAPGELA